MVAMIALSFAMFAGVNHSTKNPPNDESANRPLYVCSEKHPLSEGPCGTPPRVTHHPQPEYSEQARTADYEGRVILWLVVGTDGRAHDIKVARSLGMGLDENAIKAVRRWKFKPSEYNGKPVPVQINVEINFRLH